MFLVIAEKPSVSQAIAKVIGAYKSEDGYLSGKDCLVSWCLGHLAEYVPPEIYDEKYRFWQYQDLPIIPQDWQLAISKDKREQFEVLKDLLNRSDIAYVVNACDAGREGELIFQRVYELSGSALPIKRLWISSMEDMAIRKGFEELKDGSVYENLCQAAISRAQADWLIGMNATRAFTTTYGKTFKVGRVQTPTLAMLVERQERIDGFQKEAYYKVALTHKGMVFVSENMADEKEADCLAASCEKKQAVIQKLSKEQKKSSPPKLYDLTSLQREANRYYGYTAKKTLDILQELYEEKLVTYPRTDSQYVTEDMAGTVAELVSGLPGMFPKLSAKNLSSHVEKVINNAKVTDHHAILPTKQAMGKDWETLPEGKKKLMHLIGQQVLQAVADDFLYEQTEITVTCENHAFTAKGKKITQPGYEEIEAAFRKAYLSPKKSDGEDAEENGAVLEDLSEGMVLSPVAAKKTEHFTAPPKPYSEDTLLSAMETAGNKEFDKETEKKGLGTPATRASIIEKLVSSKYAMRKGKQILPTKDGKELIGVLPDYLKSASMTAEWENQLLAMERGEVGSAEFMEGIKNLITMVLNGCEALTEEEKQRFCTKEAVGTCPVCGSPVYEGRNSFDCSNQDCSFALWRENRYLASMRKKMDKTMAAELLKEGKTFVKDLYSAKKDKYFDAILVMSIADRRVNFSLDFSRSEPAKGSKKGKKKSSKK